MICTLEQFQFWVTFQVTLCSHYFCRFCKKGPRPKWTIYESNKNIKYLSVGNLGNFVWPVSENNIKKLTAFKFGNT